MNDINYAERGREVRLLARQLVLDYLNTRPEAESRGPGISQTEISRACGLLWGDYPKSAATQQQYWIVGLLRQLEQEERISQDPVTRKWRCRSGG